MLNTEKMEKIIEKFGGDLNKIETNLESERLDYLLEDVKAGGGYAPRHISFYNFPYGDVNVELSQMSGENLESLKYSFYSSKATDIKIDTKLPKLTTMDYMCNNVTTLKNVEINGNGCTTLQTMVQTFNSCSNLTKAVLKGFTGENLTSMARAFGSCSNLLEVDMSCFGLTKCGTYGDMFTSCSKLKKIDLSNLDTTSTSISLSYTFYGCSSLEYLDMRNFPFNQVNTTTKAFTNVPTDCEIIVKDETQKTALLTIWSTFTNVKTVAELG